MFKTEEYVQTATHQMYGKGRCGEANHAEVGYNSTRQNENSIRKQVVGGMVGLGSELRR
jgi:hypothetical protein